jgi:adenylate cyclase
MNDIVRVSQQNNSEHGITGVLFIIDQVFFQVIEGNKQDIINLFEKIQCDKRHTQVICLKTEEVVNKLFPDWSMQLIDLNDRDKLAIVNPITTLLNSIADSQSILAKYTQPTIHKLIQRGMNPLHVPLKRVERIILFCDIVSFTSFTETMFQCEERDQNKLVDMLNTFLTICNATIEKYGGEVTKFIGDSILAYFPAECAIQTIQCVHDIITQLEQIRYFYRTHGHEDTKEESVTRYPHEYLYGTMAITKGYVMEGNMGASQFKQDYTIIGDAVNTCSRLQSHVKDTGYSVLFDHNLYTDLCNTIPNVIVETDTTDIQLVTKDSLVELGCISLRGKSIPQQVYSMKQFKTPLDQNIQIFTFLQEYFSSNYNNNNK